jgi:tRNA nucleotidyltransferase (CCA-adding enzyme)
LTGHYGSFENLLRSSQRWDLKEVIDPENHYPKKDVFFQLNQSKLVSPIIVIDPVDKERNASAALSMEKFLEFKRLAKEYLQKPSPEFFKKKPKDLISLKKEAELLHANLVFMTIIPLEGKIDVVGSQMVKAYEFIKEKLIPFSIKKSGWAWEKANPGEAVFYYLAQKKELPKFELRYGPPITFNDHVRAFRKKYPDAYEDNGRMAIRVPARNPRLEDFLAEILNNEYFNEKIRKVKVVKVV